MGVFPPLFKGTVASGTTKFVGMPIRDGKLGGQISWLDATSAATITLEMTCFDENDAPLLETGAAHEWKGSGITITGPTAAGADSTLVNVENVRQYRARLKIVATANCSFEIYNGVREA